MRRLWVGKPAIHGVLQLGLAHPGLECHPFRGGADLAVGQGVQVAGRFVSAGQRAGMTGDGFRPGDPPDELRGHARRCLRLTSGRQLSLGVHKADVGGLGSGRQRGEPGGGGGGRDRPGASLQLPGQGFAVGSADVGDRIECRHARRRRRRRRRHVHRCQGRGARGGSTAELVVVAGGGRVFGFIAGRGVVHADGGVGRLLRAGAHVPEQPVMACVEVAHDGLRCRIAGAGGYRCGVVEIGAQQRAGEVDEFARAAEAVGVDVQSNHGFIVSCAHRGSRRRFCGASGPARSGLGGWRVRRWVRPQRRRG